MDLSSSSDDEAVPRRKPAKKKLKRESLVGNDDFLENLLSGGAGASDAAVPVQKAAKAALPADGPKGTIGSYFGAKPRDESRRSSSSSGGGSSRTSGATSSRTTTPKPTTPKAPTSATWISTKDNTKRAKALSAEQEEMLKKLLKNTNRYVWAKRILPKGRTSCSCSAIANGSFIMTLGRQLHGRVRRPGSEDEKKLKLRRQVEMFFRSHPKVTFKKKHKMAAATLFLHSRKHKSAKAVKDELRKKAKAHEIDETIIFSDVPKSDRDPRGSESLVLAVEELELDEPSADWLWWPALVVDRNDRCMLAQDPYEHIEEGDVWYHHLGKGDDYRLVRWFPLVNPNYTLKGSGWKESPPVASHYAVVQSVHTERFKTTKKSRTRCNQKMAKEMKNEGVFDFIEMTARLKIAYDQALKLHAGSSCPAGESSLRFVGPSQCSQSQSQSQSQSPSSQRNSSSQFDEDEAAAAAAARRQKRQRDRSGGSSSSSGGGKAASTGTVKAKEPLEAGDTIFYESTMAMSGQKGAGRRAVIVEIRVDAAATTLVMENGDKLNAMHLVQVRAVFALSVPRGHSRAVRCGGARRAPCALALPLPCAARNPRAPRRTPRSLLYASLTLPTPLPPPAAACM